MLAFLPSRRVARAAALGAWLLPSAALAQAPPAAPAPAYAVPGGYAPPPGYAPYAAPPGGYYGQAPPPYVPRRRRSSAMMAAGIALLAAGSTGLIVGTALVARGSPTDEECVDCAFISSDTGAKTAGIAMLVVSVASIGIGLPLLLVGVKRVPDTSAAALVPDVRLGAGGGAVTWRFH